MDSFLKKVLSNKGDDISHRNFIRFGKGNFNRRFLIKLDKGKEKIRIKTSFELANDLIVLAAELGGGNVSGIVLSKKAISSIMSKNNILGNSEEKRGGLFYNNNISSQELNGEQIMALVSNSYFSLINVEGKDFNFKTKEKLPKPGKNEEKIDDKFCSFELDLKYWEQVKDAFFWDLPDCKKAMVEHDLIIKEIEFPKGEEDPVKIRELAKRMGKIIRRATCDGIETSKEYELNA